MVNVNLDQLGITGWNCLHFACHLGRLEVVNYLINEVNVDPNLFTSDLWTALQLASYQGFKEIVEILLTNGRVEVNAKSSDKHCTALHCAAKGSHLKVI